MKEVFNLLVNNQLLLFGSVTVMCFTLYLIIRLIIGTNTHVDIDRKGFHVNKEIPGGIEKRDTGVYKYFTEKVSDCVKEICVINAKLQDKQVDLFSTNFLLLYKIIVQEFEIGYEKWCEHSKKTLPKDLYNTSEYLKYCLIIKEITQENLSNIHAYVKDNDLWQYDDKEWPKYKKKNARKYMDISREKFQIMYSQNVCGIPVLWHNANIMKTTEQKLLSVINCLQEDLRVNSIKYHAMVLEKESDLECYKALREPGKNGSSL